MRSIDYFTWGYWGWGTNVPELLRGVDGAERASGFKPPFFVDIREARECHRSLAAAVLSREARHDRIRLRVSEWPDTTPSRKVHLIVKADDRCMTAIRRRLEWIPLPAAIRPAVAAVLPWGALIRFDYDGEQNFAVTGEVLHQKGAWCLRKIEYPSDADGIKTSLNRAKMKRTQMGLVTEASGLPKALTSRAVAAALESSSTMASMSAAIRRVIPC